MKLSEFITLDGTAIAQLIKNKEVTKAEIVEASYAQLDKVNGKINAVTATRKESARKEAKASERSGTFAGVPIYLKDISQSLAGEKMTSGSRLFADLEAKESSYFTQRLLGTGLLPLGHSTTPEFGLKNITESKLHGPTRNPWNEKYSPGGSSGGAAALVASGVVPIAGASDGGGSIRIPASFCGLVGLKPTRGRMPVGPGVGRQWQGASIDFVLSRSVRDSASMLDELQTLQAAAAFQTPLLPGKSLDVMQKEFKDPLKIGFTTKSPVGTPVSDAAKAAVMKTVKLLEAAGHEMEEAENTIDGIQLMRDYYLMNSGEIAALTRNMEAAFGRKMTAEDMEIETWLLHVAGQSVSAAEFSLSLASWDIAAEKMARYHEKYDFYLTPATAYTAPGIGELTHTAQKEAILQEKIARATSKNQQALIYEMFLPSLTYTPFTQLANLTGQPAISLPIHLAEDGMPIGVQFVGPKGSEHGLLQIAHLIEQSSIWQGMAGNKYFQK